jgi:hypothetical protein
MMGLVTPFEPKNTKKGEIRNEKNQRKMKGDHPKKKRKEKAKCRSGLYCRQQVWKEKSVGRQLYDDGRAGRNYSEGYEGAFRLCI